MHIYLFSNFIVTIFEVLTKSITAKKSKMPITKVISAKQYNEQNPGKELKKWDEKKQEFVNRNNGTVVIDNAGNVKWFFSSKQAHNYVHVNGL